MKNTTREKMLRGEKTLGTFLELGSATVAECLGLGEMDYCIIDTEHGPFDPLAALDFIRAARLYGMTPFARTQEISRAAILKLLDAGAQGLIIPCVNTVEEAEAIVRYGKYGPVGERGVANAAGRIFGIFSLSLSFWSRLFSPSVQPASESMAAAAVTAAAARQNAV